MVRPGKRILTSLLAITTLWSSIPVYGEPQVERRVDTANYEDAVYAGAEVDGETSSLVLNPKTQEGIGNVMYKEAPRFGITGGPVSSTAPTAQNPHHAKNGEILEEQLEKVKSTDWMIQDKNGYYVNIWGEYIRYGGDSSTNLAGSANKKSNKVYDILGAKYMTYSSSSELQKYINQVKEQKKQDLNSPTYAATNQLVKGFQNNFNYGLSLAKDLYGITTTAGDQNQYKSIAQRYTSGSSKAKLGGNSTEWATNNHMLETTEYTAVDSYTVNKVDSTGAPVTADVKGTTVYDHITKPAHNVFEQTDNLPIMNTDFPDKIEYTYTRTRYAVNVMQRLRGTNHHSRYYVLGRQFDGKYKFEELVTPYLDISDDILAQPHSSNGDIHSWGEKYYNTTLKDENDSSKYTKRNQIPKKLADQNKINADYKSDLTEAQESQILEAASNAYGMHLTSLIYRLSKQKTGAQNSYLPSRRGDSSKPAVLKVRFSDLYEDWGFEDYDWTEGNKSALFYFSTATHKELNHKEDSSGTVTDSGLKIPGEAGLLNNASNPNPNANYYVQQPNPLDFNPIMINKYWLDTSKYIDNNSNEYATHVALDRERPDQLSRRSELKGIINASQERLSAMANAGYFKFWNAQTLEELFNYLAYCVKSQFDYEIEQGAYSGTDYMDRLLDNMRHNVVDDDGNKVADLYHCIDGIIRTDPVNGKQPVSFTEVTDLAKGLYNYEDVQKDISVTVKEDGVANYNPSTPMTDYISVEGNLPKFSITQALPAPKTWYPLLINNAPAEGYLKPEETITKNKYENYTVVQVGYKDAVGVFSIIDDALVVTSSKDINTFRVYTTLPNKEEKEFSIYDSDLDNAVASASRTLRGKPRKITGKEFGSNILVTKQGYVLDATKCSQVKLDKDFYELENLPDTIDVTQRINGTDYTVSVEESYVINLLLYRPNSEAGIILTDDDVADTDDIDMATGTGTGCVEYSGEIKDHDVEPDPDRKANENYFNTFALPEYSTLGFNQINSYKPSMCVLGTDDEDNVYYPIDENGNATTPKHVTDKLINTFLGTVPLCLCEVETTGNVSFKQATHYNAQTDSFEDFNTVYTWYSNYSEDKKANKGPSKTCTIDGELKSDTHYTFMFAGTTPVISDYTSNVPSYFNSFETVRDSSEEFSSEQQYLSDADLNFEYNRNPKITAEINVFYKRLQITDMDELLKVNTDLVSDPMIQFSKQYYWSMIPEFYSRILFSDYDYKPQTIRDKQWIQPGRDLNLAPHSHEKKQYYTYDFYYQELDSEGVKRYQKHTPLQFDLDFEQGYDSQDDVFKNTFSEYVGRTVFLYDELAKYAGLTHENQFVNDDNSGTTYPLGPKFHNARLSIEKGDPREMQEFNPTYKWALYPYYNGLTDFNPFFCDRYAKKAERGEELIDTYQSTTLQENLDSGLIIMNPWDVIWEPENPTPDELKNNTTYTYAEVLAKGDNKGVSNGLVGFRPAAYQPKMLQENLTTATFPMYDPSEGNEHIELPGIDVHRFVILVRPRGYRLETENVSVTTVEPQYATTDGMSVIDGVWNNGVEKASDGSYKITHGHDSISDKYFSTDQGYETLRAYNGFEFPILTGNNNTLYETTTASKKNYARDGTTEMTSETTSILNSAGLGEWNSIVGTQRSLVGSENNYKLYNAMNVAVGQQGAVHYPMLYGQLGYNNFDQRYIVDNNALVRNDQTLADIVSSHHSDIDASNAGEVANASFNYLRWGNYLSYKVERNVVPAGYPVIAELLPDYADGLHVIEAHTGEHYNVTQDLDLSEMLKDASGEYGVIEATDKTLNANYLDTEKTESSIDEYTQYTNYDNTDSTTTSDIYNKVYNTRLYANSRDVQQGQYKKYTNKDGDDIDTYNTNALLIYIDEDGDWEEYDAQQSVGLPEEARLKEFSSMSNLKALNANNFSASYYSTMDTRYVNTNGSIVPNNWYFRQKYLGTKKSDYVYDVNGQRRVYDTNAPALDRDRNQTNTYSKDSVYRLLTSERTTMTDSVLYHTFAFTMPSNDVSLENNGAVNIVYNYDQTPTTETDNLFDNVQYIGMRATTSYSSAKNGTATGYFNPSQSSDISVYNGLGVLSDEKLVSSYYVPYSIEPNTVSILAKPKTDSFTNDKVAEELDERTDKDVGLDVGATYGVQFKIQANNPNKNTHDYKYIYTWARKRGKAYQVDDPNSPIALGGMSYADYKESDRQDKRYAIPFRYIYLDDDSSIYGNYADEEGESDYVNAQDVKRLRTQMLDLFSLPAYSSSPSVVTTMPQGVLKKMTEAQELAVRPWDKIFPAWAFTSPEYSYIPLKIGKGKVGIKNFKNDVISAETLTEMQSELSDYDTALASDLSKVHLDPQQEKSLNKLFKSYQKLTNKFSKKKNAALSLEGLSKPSGATQKNVTQIEMKLNGMSSIYELSPENVGETGTTDSCIWQGIQTKFDMNNSIFSSGYQLGVLGTKPKRSKSENDKAFNKVKINLNKGYRSKMFKALANFFSVSFTEGYLDYISNSEESRYKMPKQYDNELTPAIYLNLATAELESHSNGEDVNDPMSDLYFTSGENPGWFEQQLAQVVVNDYLRWIIEKADGNNLIGSDETVKKNVFGASAQFQIEKNVRVKPDKYAQSLVSPDGQEYPNAIHIYADSKIKGQALNIYIPYKVNSEHSYTAGNIVFGIPVKNNKVNYQNISKTVFENARDWSAGLSLDGKQIGYEVYLTMPTTDFSKFLRGSFEAVYSDDAAYWDPFVQYQKYPKTFLETIAEKCGVESYKKIHGITIFTGSSATSPGIPVQARYSYSKVKGLKQIASNVSGANKIQFKIKKNTFQWQKLNSKNVPKPKKAKVPTIIMKTKNSSDSSFTYSISTKKTSKEVKNFITNLWQANYYYFSLYTLQHAERNGNEVTFPLGNGAGFDADTYKSALKRQNIQSSLTYSMSNLDYYVFLNLNNLLKLSDIPVRTITSSGDSTVNGKNLTQLNTTEYLDNTNRFLQDAQGVHRNRANLYMVWAYQWDNTADSEVYPSVPYLDIETNSIRSSDDVTEVYDSTVGKSLVTANHFKYNVSTGTQKVDESTKIFYPSIGQMRYTAPTQEVESVEADVAPQSNAYTVFLPYVYPFSSFSKQQYKMLTSMVAKNLTQNLDRAIMTKKKESYLYRRSNTIRALDRENAMPAYGSTLPVQDINKDVAFTHDDLFSNQEELIHQFGMNYNTDALITSNANLNSLVYPSLSAIANTGNSRSLNLGYKSGAYTWVQTYQGTNNTTSVLGYATTLLHAPIETKNDSEIVIYPSTSNVPVRYRYILSTSGAPTMRKFNGVNAAQFYSVTAAANSARMASTSSIYTDENNDYDYNQAEESLNILNDTFAILNGQSDQYTTGDLSNARVYLNNLSASKAYNENYLTLLNPIKLTGSTDGVISIYDYTSKISSETYHAKEMLGSELIEGVQKFSGNDMLREITEASFANPKYNIKKQSLFSTLYPDKNATLGAAKAAYSKYFGTVDGYTSPASIQPSYDEVDEDEGDISSDESVDEDDSSEEEPSGSGGSAGDATETNNKGYMKWKNFKQVSYYDYEPTTTSYDKQKGVTVDIDGKKQAGMIYAFPYVDSGSVRAAAHSLAVSERNSGSLESLSAYTKLSSFNRNTKFVIGLTHGGSGKKNVQDTWIMIVPNSTGQAATVYLANFDTSYNKLVEFNSPITLLGSTQNSASPNFSITLNPVEEKSQMNDTIYNTYKSEGVTYTSRFEGVTYAGGFYRAHTPRIVSNASMHTEYNGLNVSTPNSYSTTKSMFKTVASDKAADQDNFWYDGGFYHINARNATNRESTVYSQYAFPKYYIIPRADIHDVYRNGRQEYAHILPEDTFAQFSGFQLDDNYEQWLEYQESRIGADRDERADLKEERKRIIQRWKDMYASSKNLNRLSVVSMDPTTYKWQLNTAVYPDAAYLSLGTVDDDSYVQALQNTVTDKLSNGKKFKSAALKKTLKKTKAFKHYFGKRLTLTKNSNTKKFNVKVKYAEPISIGYIKDKDDSGKRNDLAKRLMFNTSSLWDSPYISSQTPAINIQAVDTIALDVAVNNVVEHNISMMFSSDYHCIPSLLAASTISVYDLTGISDYEMSGTGSNSYVSLANAQQVTRNDTRTAMAANDTAGISGQTYLTPLDTAQYNADGRFVYKDVATYGLSSPIQGTDASNKDMTAYSRVNGGKFTVPGTGGSKYANTYMALFNSADRMRYFKDLLLFGSYSADYSQTFNSSANTIDFDIKSGYNKANNKHDFVTVQPDNNTYNPMTKQRNKSVLDISTFSKWLGDETPTHTNHSHISTDDKSLVNEYIVKPSNFNAIDGTPTQQNVNTNYYYNKDMLHTYVEYTYAFDRSTGKYTRVAHLVDNVDENITPEYLVIPMGMTDYSNWYIYATRLTLYNTSRGSSDTDLTLYRMRDKDYKLTYNIKKYTSTKPTDDGSTITKDTPMFNLPEKLTYQLYFENDNLGVGTGRNVVVSSSSLTAGESGYTGENTVRTTRDVAQFLFATNYYYVNTPSMYTKSGQPATRYSELVGASFGTYANSNRPGAPISKMASTPTTSRHAAANGSEFYANGLLVNNTVAFENYTQKINGDKVVNDTRRADSDDEDNFTIFDSESRKSVVEKTPYTDTEGISVVNRYLSTYR